ncbi:MAG: insulinase family protein [Acidobacteria bacterium]|nr:MAG: insulinase family protein [Acidobacteriota bacterium]
MALHAESHRLANGLTVLVHEDRQAPLAAVSVWYHVGSKNEVRGRTGLAHLFEHVMFEGSEHVTTGFFEPLQRVGGTLNGSTSQDRTNYWEVVPTGALELALWMEADRMGWLLPALSDERFAMQREVVLNERRQSYENRPYGLAHFAMLDALHQDGHPYKWPVIGDPADLRAASVDDARAFFSRYYHPGNASVAVAGDVSPDAVFALAEKLFGAIPPGPAIERVIAPTMAAPAARLMLEDQVELPRLYLAWPSPALFGADDAELDLAADMLANGKTSRLYRTLVHEQRMVADLGASQGSRELQGMFQVTATAAPGKSLIDIHDAVMAAIGAMAERGPTVPELAREQTHAEAAFLSRLQTLGGFGGKSDQLNFYQTYLGKPDAADDDLNRYLGATPTSVRDAVNEWLRPDRRVALSVVPSGRADLALPGSRPSGVA